MAKRRQPSRPKAIRDLAQAMKLARAQGNFDGVHPSAIAYAARRGMARPNPAGSGWVPTEQGLAWRPYTS